MTLLQTLKSVVEQRLCAVAEHIFMDLERILTELEEPAVCSKQQHTTLQLHVHTADVPLLAAECKEEFSSEYEQQERSSSLVWEEVMEEPEPPQEEPEPPQVKEEEQEELLLRPMEAEGSTLTLAEWEENLHTLAASVNNAQTLSHHNLPCSKSTNSYIAARVLSVLPSLPAEVLVSVVERLTYHGAVTEKELRYVAEEDLEGLAMTPIQCRKLLRAWKSTASVLLEPCSDVIRASVLSVLPSLPAEVLDSVVERLTQHRAETEKDLRYVTEEDLEGLMLTPIQCRKLLRAWKQTEPVSVSAPPRQTSTRVPLDQSSSVSTSIPMFPPPASPRYWPENFKVDWDTMPTNLLTALQNGKRPSPEDRRLMVRLIVDNMRRIVANPRRAECLVIARNIVDQFPQSFIDSVDDIDVTKKRKTNLKGDAYDSLLSQIKTRVDHLNRTNNLARLRRPRKKNRAKPQQGPPDTQWQPRQMSTCVPLDQSSSVSTSIPMFPPPASPRYWPENFKVDWDRMPTNLLTALQNGKRPSPADRRQMVRLIVDDMRRIVANPRRAECLVIARNIVDQFPQSFIDSMDGVDVTKNRKTNLKGDAYDSLLSQIKARVEHLNRANNLARHRRPWKKNRAKPPQGPPDMQWQPELPPEETEESLENKRRTLTELFSRNGSSGTERADVCELMERTYPLQRRTINADPAPGLHDVKQRWPYLFFPGSMCAHFERLTDVPLPRRIGAFLEERGGDVMELFKRNPTNGAVEAVLHRTDGSATATNILQVLMAHFEEPLDALIIQTDESATPAFVQLTVPLVDSPRLIVAGPMTNESHQRWMLSIEKQVLCEGTSFLEGLAVVFASYYCFNLQYQHEAACTLEFIQRSCIDVSPEGGTGAGQVTMEQGKKGGENEMVKKKSTLVDPRVAALIKQLSDFRRNFV